jgi:hypothetical protein
MIAARMTADRIIAGLVRRMWHGQTRQSPMYARTSAIAAL